MAKREKTDAEKLFRAFLLAYHRGAGKVATESSPPMRPVTAPSGCDSVTDEIEDTEAVLDVLYGIPDPKPQNIKDAILWGEGHLSGLQSCHSSVC